MTKKQYKFPPKTLHLFLKHRWYDMIETGEKPWEYRDIEKWGRKVCTYGRTEYCLGNCRRCKYLIVGGIYHTTIERVCLHRGYTSTTMTFTVPIIKILEGKVEWGAPKDKEVIGLFLDSRIRKD